jgi:hypothetical protein
MKENEERVQLDRLLRNMSNNMAAGLDASYNTSLSLSFKDRVSDGHHMIMNSRDFKNYDVVVCEIKEALYVDGSSIPHDICYVNIYASDSNLQTQPDYFIGQRWIVSRGNHEGELVPTLGANSIFGASLVPFFNYFGFDADEFHFQNRGRLLSDSNISIRIWLIKFKNEHEGVAFIHDWIVKFRKATISGYNKSNSIEKEIKELNRQAELESNVMKKLDIYQKVYHLEASLRARVTRDGFQREKVRGDYER